MRPELSSTLRKHARGTSGPTRADPARTRDAEPNECLLGSDMEAIPRSEADEGPA